jgi:site-specific recombinase XerD
MLGCRNLSDDEIELINKNLNSHRDRLLFKLGINTGFRISELLSIKIVDLYEFNGELKTELTVSRKNMKGKLASRSVPLSLDLLRALKTYLQATTKYQVFLFDSQKSGQLSRCQAWRSIKQAARQAGLNGKIATHSMRKCLASRAYETSGHDLAITQRILGHKNVSSTISYLQVDQASVNELWKKIQKG